MARYFLDTRDNDAIIVDDEGVELPDLDAVKVQAARSLAELALDVLPGSIRRKLGVDVRDEAGQPVIVTELTFEARLLVELAG
jgi:hypothetical protein